MPSIFEPVAAGIAVAIFNKYVLNKFDPLGWCYAHCCEKENDDDFGAGAPSCPEGATRKRSVRGDDCVSSSSTSATADACHVHHF
jgi:hypothetical protein